MLPEDDRVIEICRSVLNVLMQILDLLNNIYVHVFERVIKHNFSVLIFSKTIAWIEYCGPYSNMY